MCKVIKLEGRDLFSLKGIKTKKSCVLNSAAVYQMRCLILDI